MMIRERVTTPNRTYEIVIGPRLLPRTGEFLQELKVRQTSRHLVITDENVRAAGHLEPVLASLQSAGYQADVYVIPPGEASKSLERAGAAFQYAYEIGLDRRSVVLALGGGVVGDFAGFVAAGYMRGIDFVQLPTTLLAHDSAVGGKVAVNLPQAKNIVGAFHQPLAVLYDTEALKTLPLRERRAGLVEAIKHGLIRDRDLFDWIEEKMDVILSGEDAVVAELLARSCRIKAEVVSQDEKELGLRAILNFGHTLGHAVEGLANGRFVHGEAVAIGLVAAADLSVELGYCERSDLVADTERVLIKAGLPTRIPQDLGAKDLLVSMRKDKKATGATLTFVLLRDIGETEIVHDVPEAAVRRMIDKWREE
ncbi:MAG TPA: 3-dehydroquinate synthase [Bacilli bacterium]|nr:3-dehydroquinate synthase [Bacilli bacterium]